MATAATAYETVYVLKPNLSESETSAVHEKVDSVISKFKGKLLLRDEWGQRELAYTIRHHNSGNYVIVNYTGEPGVVEEIERHFKISGLVIRYLTSVTEEEYDYAKVKKQIHVAEEEMKKAREMRRKRD